MRQPHCVDDGPSLADILGVLYSILSNVLDFESHILAQLEHFNLFKEFAKVLTWKIIGLALSSMEGRCSAELLILSIIFKSEYTMYCSLRGGKYLLSSRLSMKLVIKKKIADLRCNPLS